MTARSWLEAGLAVAGLALAAAAPAGAQAEAKQRFGEVTEVVEVEIPVHVVAGGEPVRGLTAEDFEVYEGRRRRPITGFQVVDLAGLERGTPELGAELPPAARRHILLLFDLTYARPAAIVRAREAARELVLGKLRPGDLVAVATYAVRHGTSLVLGFTPDRRQVEAAIDSLGLPQLIDRVNDPLGFVLTTSLDRTFDVDAPIAQDGPAAAMGEAVKRLAYVEIMESLELYSLRNELLDRDVQRNLAASFTDGLGALGRLLASVEGDKQVILLSEGFDSSLLLGTGEREEIEEQATAASFGELWNVDSERRFGSASALQMIERMADAFRRADATVHAVDIGGLRAAGDASGDPGGAASVASSEDSLFVIADSTGGELFRNFNDLGEALDRLVEQTGVTYLLSFDPGDIELDGAFHPIEVRLKGGPRGARAIHRPGYYAPKPAALEHPVERRLTAADLLLRNDDSGPIASSVMVAAWPGPGADGSLPVLVEIDGEDLLAGRTQGLVSLELYGYAFGPDGRVGGFFSQSLALDAAKHREALVRQGLTFFGHLELAPGDYSLRVLVRDPATALWSFRRVEVTVPGGLGDGEYVLTVRLAAGAGGAPTVGSVPITVVAGESR